MEQTVEEQAERIQAQLADTREEIAKHIVGHEPLVEEILVCLLCKGHALLEGVPGLGKTSLIKTFGSVLDLEAKRIQFTPDLMPADILGTKVLMRDQEGAHRIEFQAGPIFSQIVLADEINRATPKTQSALLEAMQEQRVTIGGETMDLDQPFIVLATQNPIEMEGTYPLPEAQMDRFFFKLLVDYPSRGAMQSIVDRTTGPQLPDLRTTLDAQTVREIQEFIREVPVSEEVRDYAVRIVFATHPDGEEATDQAARLVRYGASPRGAQSMVLAGKVFAVLDNRLNVSFADIRRAALPSLRHRLILNFEGEAEGYAPDDIVKDLLERVSPVDGE
jgi:MoxR-like ATPase